MLKRAVEREYLGVLPHGGGILLNDVPAKLDNVTRHDYRVDLELGGNAAFLVEHALGCLLLAGVNSAKVYGTSRDYDSARQTHRDAEARGMPPSVVLGNPYGTLDAELYHALREASTREILPRRVSVENEASYSSQYGSIKVSPSDRLFIKVEGRDLSYEFEMGDEEKALEIARSETPYLGGLTEKSIPHVVGDILGDIVGIGGINCAEIEMRPGKEYHRVTIGVLRKLVKAEL